MITIVILIVILIIIISIIIIKIIMMIIIIIIIIMIIIVMTIIITIITKIITVIIRIIILIVIKTVIRRVCIGHLQISALPTKLLYLCSSACMVLVRRTSRITVLRLLYRGSTTSSALGCSYRDITYSATRIRRLNWPSQLQFSSPSVCCSLLLTVRNA